MRHSGIRGGPTNLRVGSVCEPWEQLGCASFECAILSEKPDESIPLAKS